MQKRIISLTVTILLLLTSWMTAVASTLQTQDMIDTDANTAQYLASVLSNSPVSDAGGPYTGVIYVPVTFDGSHSYDSDGTILSYTWYCGDGFVETGVAPTHIYSTPGTYTLILTVKDNEGNCGTDSTTVSITTDNPPTIELTNPLENFAYFRNQQISSLPSSTIVIGPCEISVDATDDVAIRRVEFYIDDVLRHVDYDEPYSMKWNTGLFQHTIKAVAYDSSGHQTSVENTVFKWRVHPILLLGMFSLLRRGKTIDWGSWFSDRGTNQQVLLTLLRLYFGSSQNDTGIIMDLIEKLLREDQNSLDIVEFLNNHPLLKKGLKEQYPLLFSVLMLSNGVFDAKNPHLFEKHRLLKIIILFAIIQAIQTHDKKKLFDGSHGMDSIQWIRDHPLFVLMSSLLILTLLSKKSNTGDENVAPDITTENKPPQANVGGPYEEHVGVPVMFSAEKSYDEDGTIVVFEWDFGDGTKGTGKTVNHQYNSTGTYVVTLTVTDDDGKTSTDTTVIMIKPSGENNPADEANINPVFWIVSGLLSSLLLLGLAGVKFRRRLFE